MERSLPNPEIFSQHPIMAYSFIYADKKSYDFVDKTLQQYGLIDAHISINNSPRTDGNLSVNLWQDLGEYAQYEDGLLTMWHLKSADAADGTFLWEKKIRPRHQLSAQEISALESTLEANPLLQGDDPYTSLQWILERNGKEEVDQDGETAVVTKYNHTVLPPNRLIAIAEIPNQGRDKLREFGHDNIPILLSSYQTTIAESSKQLRELLDQYCSFRVQKTSTSDMSKAILDSMYDQTMRYRSMMLMRNIQNNSERGISPDYALLRDFTEINPRDYISKRYLDRVVKMYAGYTGGLSPQEHKKQLEA